MQSLQRRIGSMDFVDSLLIMEDDDTDDELDAVPLEASAAPTSAVAEAIPSTHPHVSTSIPHQPRPAEESLPAWCKCRNCCTMPQEIRIAKTQKQDLQSFAWMLMSSHLASKALLTSEMTHKTIAASIFWTNMAT